MSLHQIIYTSHAVAPMDAGALIDLLTQSRHDNKALGITGLLLYADGSFMQTIEGEFDPVQRLFARIEKDERHAGVILMCDEPVIERSFADWSMAFREIDHEQAESIPGFRGALAPGDGASSRDMARRVMQSFATSTGLKL